ncbi:hypothetical protein AKJ57_02790 [candidate division MSBL1 archaeon SCGC-AAA259A05]|uniref:ADP-ribosylglycohydrolase n=1 Tax=candidate division MSBL1 archaeon SCGC-AAA259A05 TaxID=1698259 RepID=A0A133UA22_9EURY|nr:hypothetical protein AKJ57_02790 [candidate division MSBL1 archaeon SCGC-AAA259A05]
MDLKSKFRGSLLGTGIGDSLGRSCEGGTGSSSERIRGMASRCEVLRYTDDTQQMMALAESLIEGKGFDGKLFAQKLVEDFDISRGYGPGSVQVIKSFERGESWTEPAKRLFGGSGSYGNGSSMRIAPVGLFAHDNLDGLRSLAERSSRVTHAHRLGKEGAVLQASSVALATRRDPSSEFNPEEFLRKIREFIEEDEYEEKLDRLGELLSADPDRSEVVESLGNGIEAFNSVPVAVYSFLSHPESFERAVVYAVSLGGDADTIGAMTGAIAGAYHGSKEIPAEWREKLEDGNPIIELADGLFEIKTQ